MISQKLQEKVEFLLLQFERINQFFIQKVAEQIKKIGELTQSSINRLVIMSEMNQNVAKITAQLAEATQKSTSEIYDIYETAMQDTYTDPRFSNVINQTPISDETRARLEHYTRTISMQTAGTMQNISNTTAVSATYRHAVDRAILAVSSGLDDYKAATRTIIRDVGYNGMQVQYESGHHRRLDTAVRQNVLDGVKQIAQNGSILMGDELGFDAYELSAHLHSAPDHEPIQGRVFLKEEFIKMQTGQPFSDVDGNSYPAMRRPIGEWNCMHIAMSFSTQHSIRRYTEEQLKQWIDDNHKGCDFNGKHYTIYQMSQLMRKIETAVRREKDAANAARIAGDDELRRQCQRNINALVRQYADISNFSGLKQRKDRMQVEGFRMVKV